MEVKGDLTWYYFSASNELSGLGKSIRFSRQFYTIVPETSAEVLVKENEVFKTGTRVRVKLTIESNKPLKYVQLDDYRSAAFEPVNPQSGYHYGDGLSYYQAIKDTGFQIFAEFIPSGRSELSYELLVVNEGVFYNGPAALTCMYRPEVSAYSNGLKIRVSE